MMEILVPYYRNPKMLELQIDNWHQWPWHVRKETQITIVDDGSPEPIRFKGDDRLNVSIYRIKENIPWNIAGAKNLLAHICGADWFLMHDIDYVVNYGAMAAILQLDLSKPNTYYNFHVENARPPSRRRPSKITMLMNINTFWEVGGFNEAFSGHWGLQMSDLRQRLKRKRKKAKLSKITLMHFDSEDVEDASTIDWERDSTENLKKIKEKPKQERKLQFDWELVDAFACQK